MNVSERVLERSIDRAARRIRTASVVYQTVRNSLVGFGLTAAVFLPLAGQSPPASQTSGQPIVNLTPTLPVVLNPGARESDTIEFKPNVEVVVNTSPIVGAPPINRSWHRTKFSVTGDEFWALPDADFTLRFERGADFAGCVDEACRGTFRMYSRSGALLATFATEETTEEKRGITAVGENVGGGQVDCAVQADGLLTPTAACKHIGKHGPYCVWLRRSEHLVEKYEKPKAGAGRLKAKWDSETIALDVRWQNVPNGDCLALLPF